MFPEEAVVFGAALPLAWAVDRWWGEPPVRWHPVVWIGHYLNWAAQYVQGGAPLPSVPLSPQPPDGEPGESPQPDYKAFTLGALAWMVGAAVVYIVSSFIEQAVFSLPLVLAAALMGLLLKPWLAWAMLRSEVEAVEACLHESLEAGRERLRWLVSRDTATLTTSEVRESAMESLAENLNDSVVAPIFWFVLFGLPGAAVYRFANTADAMWGYRGVRHGQNWAWAGKWAARADDVLSWVPARITALLIVALGASSGEGQSFKNLRVEARQTPSPNSGWPMAAMALALGIRLGKPGAYTLNATGRLPLASDTQKCLEYASKVVATLIFIAVAATVLIATIGQPGGYG